MMKHITEEYRQPTNDIESTREEFEIMKAFLEKHGVLVRKISVIDGVVKWQAKNPYKVWAELTRNENKVSKNAENEMHSRRWCW